MGKNKTAPESGSVAEFVAGIVPVQRRTDSQRLLALMSTTTGVEPVIWGSRIIGFGTHHYSYENGRRGDTVAVGFAPRGPAIVVYGLGFGDQAPELARSLGKHTTGKGCVYVKRMDDIDQDVLENLIKQAFVARHNAGT